MANTVMLQKFVETLTPGEKQVLQTVIESGHDQVRHLYEGEDLDAAGQQRWEEEIDFSYELMRAVGLG